MTKQVKNEIPITFKNERGKNLVGVLHIPDKEKPPVAIICHGFQNTKTDRKFIKLARSLREAGILVFRFDFEGCGDSEGSPRDITIEREVSDLSFAVKAVQKACDVDSKRLSLIGHSLGGVIAAVFAKNLGAVKTMILLAPAFGQKELFKNWYNLKDSKEVASKGYLIKGEKEIGKDYFFENKDKDWSDVLTDSKEPILIIHGAKDKDVPIKLSKMLAEKFPSVELRVLSKATHKFDDRASQQELIKLTVDWLKRYL